METKATVARASAATARPAPNRGGALLYWTAVATLVWCSIWIFLFQHATHQQQTLLQLPVLSILALAALFAAGRLRRPGPWACWLGAALVYVALSSAFPPSFFTSWRQTSELWFSVALSLPVFLLLGQAGLGPRLLCAICAALALAGLLDNLGVDLRVGIAALLNSDPAAEGTRIAIAADRDLFFYAMSQRANEVWALFLGWIALAALRPATRRDWLVAGGLFIVIGLVIATGYSWGAKLAFVIGIIAFVTALAWPRLTRRLSLLALLALFLGAPLWGKQVWPWFLNNLELFDWFNAHLDADRGVRRFGLWELWAALVDRHPWIGLGFNAHRGMPGFSFSEIFGGPLGAPELIRECAYATCETVAGFPHNFALQVWGELGAFGAFLVAGLVASLLVNTLPAGGFPREERDLGRAARYALLVVVVVIYSFDRVPWTMQNVIQFALLGGLAAATAGTRHPPAAVALPGLTLRRERFLILLALLAGALTLLGNSAQAHFATRPYTPHNTEFDSERARMRHQGKELDFALGVEGDIESISRQPVFRQFSTWQEQVGDAVTVRGWASDAFRAGETLLAFVFDGAELLGVTRTGRVRPAVQKISAETNLDLLFSGFELRALRPPGWLPQQGVHAVFVGPQGRAGLARLSKAARGQLEAMNPRPPPAPYRPGVLALGRDNMLIYLKEECEDSDIAPPFFLHVTPVDPANLSPLHREYGFANLDFHFEEFGTRQEGRCEVRFSLPDYDIIDIHIGQFEGGNRLWEQHISFSPSPAPGLETQDETAAP